MKQVMKMTVLLAAMMGVRAFGAPTLGYVETWSNVGNQEGWLSSGDPTIQQNTGTLEVDFPDQPSGTGWVYASGAGNSANFTGNFAALATAMQAGRSNLLVSFTIQSLTTYNTDATALQLYFVGNGHMYTLNTTLVQPSPAQGVVTNTLLISSGESGAAGLWNNLDSGTFALDFASVTQFGWQITSAQDLPATILKFDNFQLEGQMLVPEPETVWLMVMVLASLAVTFRGRISDLMASFRRSH